MENRNNSMKNATVIDDMETFTLNFYQLWKLFGSCHNWPGKIEGLLANTANNCIEQRWPVDKAMIQYHVFDPNDLLFKNIYFARVAKNWKEMCYY